MFQKGVENWAENWSYSVFHVDSLKNNFQKVFREEQLYIIIIYYIYIIIILKYGQQDQTIMMTLQLQIINKDSKPLILNLRKISKEEAAKMFESEGIELDEAIRNEKEVIAFYKEHNIDMPENLVFDKAMDGDYLVLIDEVNTRWMLE